MSAYYNEFDKEKAAWLRELIKAGLIAPGDVDERGIEDVHAADLVGYKQCHFFAGIGIWSYAMRLAGWPDKRPVWTGSCPCPSFSAAGKGAGFDDPRHLWPHWARLIRECKPPIIFGEQVDDAIGFGWLDLIQTDLEAEAYAVGKAVLGACSVGAPHIRQRLYLVAHGDAERSGRHRWTLDAERGPEGRTTAARAGEDDFVAHAAGVGSRGGRTGGEGLEPGAVERSRGLRNAGDVGDAAFSGERSRDGLSCASAGREGEAGGSSLFDIVGSPTSGGHGEAWTDCGRSSEWTSDASELLLLGSPNRRKRETRDVESLAIEQGSKRTSQSGPPLHMGEPMWTGLSDSEPQELRGTGRGHEGRAVTEPGEASPDGCGRPGPVNGFWRDADWIRCRDALWRPVRPGSLPLVTGASARVVRLRGYGDGITAQTAQAFIESVMEVIG